MTKQAPNVDAQPPQWAESLARLLLRPADRDTITGDLLEEYQEVIRPTRGPVGARRWYLRQAASLILVTHSRVQWAIWLAAAAALAVAFLMRHDVEPPFPAGAWTSLAMLGGAAFFLRPEDLGLLLRAGITFGVSLCVVAMIVPVAARLAPVPWAMWCCALLFFGAGLAAAWRAHRVGPGILAAAATALIAATLWLGLTTSISTLVPVLLDRFGPPLGGRDFDIPTSAGLIVRGVNDPLMLVMLGITPGAIGAVSGKVLSCVLGRCARRFDTVGGFRGSDAAR